MSINKSALKLSLLYLGILASICFIFSAAFYNVSLREVERGLIRGPERRQNIYANNQAELLERQIRQAVVDDLRDSLIIRLLIVNIALLSVGGVLSYIFALQTLKPIEDSKRRLEKFTADAAHDLRTPLSAMKIENEIFLDTPNLKLGDAKEQIKSNLEEVNKLINLAQSLLALSNSKETREVSVVKLNEVLESVIKTATPISANKSIKITQDINDVSVITGDRQLLERGILAIVDNSIKYSKEGSEIIITAKVDKDKKVIQIIDKGVGIANKDIEHIFDRLYRVDNSRKREDVGGHGLGLSIAKEIIESHGGTISVASKKNVGSTFKLVF